MLLTNASRGMMAAVLSLAARHALLTAYLPDISNVSNSCLQYRQEAEREALHQNEEARYVMENILSLEEVFRSPVASWKLPRTYEVYDVYRPHTTSRLVEDSLHLFWFRVGKYLEHISGSRCSNCCHRSRSRISFDAKQEATHPIEAGLRPDARSFIFANLAEAVLLSHFGAVVHPQQSTYLSS